MAYPTVNGDKTNGIAVNYNVNNYLFKTFMDLSTVYFLRIISIYD